MHVETKIDMEEVTYRTVLRPRFFAFLKLSLAIF